MATEKADGTALAIYLKLIDYKRSIGITQWTVLSVFLTASEGILAVAFTVDQRSAFRLLVIFGVVVYWLGFLLYRRYRAFNRQVSEYLVILEKELTYGFQEHLNRTVHASGLSTEWILVLAGIIYSSLGLLSAILL